MKVIYFKGEIMFFKKKKEVKKTRINIMNIMYKGGGSQDFWEEDYKGNKLIEPWKDFYKWFYFKESEYFNMTAKNYSLTIRRDDILRFSIRIIER